ncbi:MAG: ARPP-1 family domain-containing protein [Promethearchaeota archaeon]
MAKVNTIKEFAKNILTGKGIEIGKSIILNEVTFIPIIKQEVPREDREYLTLLEALEEDKCKIIEKGTEIAHIIFENLGEIPILIEEGEIFQGKGTQDRICVSTMMVEPQSQVEIGVKCVHAPHHLSSGAHFSYGGKASRAMLNEIRSMKYKNAQTSIPASNINQRKVWEKVSEENATEGSVGETKYLKSVNLRRKRAENRSKKIKFPENTIGFVVINAKGEIKGLEVHRSPHNFKIRKDGIFESLEANISWKVEGQGAFPKAREKANKLFKKISELREGESALNQLEVDGVAINMGGRFGEAFTTTFYSNICPYCSKSKPRKKECPHCGNMEEESEEMAYMSLF